MIITPDPLTKFKERLRRAYPEVFFWIEREMSVTMLFWVLVFILLLSKCWR